jgi:hypothetical protein
MTGKSEAMTDKRGGMKDKGRDMNGESEMSKSSQKADKKRADKYFTDHELVP